MQYYYCITNVVCFS